MWTNIRGLSGKYRAYTCISALALFFIIGWVASFKVIPAWLNNTVAAMFPLLETVLELTFRDVLEYARRIIFNRRFLIESLSFEWFFEFLKQRKVTGVYVGTVRRLSKKCDTVFTQKLLQKILWMRWRVIVVKKPVIAHTRVIPEILFKISQTVVFVVEGRPERESLSTEVWAPLKRLYHSFIRVLLIHSFSKAFCIIWVFSELVFPNSKQNLMQIRWSCCSVIFNNHTIRRTKK